MRIVERITTQATPQTVWEILADVERWPIWTPTVLRIEPLTGDGLKPGARFRVSQPKLRPAIYQVTDCSAPHQFTWAQTMPGVRMMADHRITATPAGTEVELSFAAEGLLGRWLGRLYSKIIAEYVATEARSLKQRADALAARDLKQATSRT